MAKDEWQLDDADTRAGIYERFLVPAIFTDWAYLLIDAAGVEPGQRILDVACGTGIVARLVAERLDGSGEVSGVDLNKSMIKVARSLSPDIDWEQANVTDMPFNEEHYDAVLCQASLLFFPDQVAARWRGGGGAQKSCKRSTSRRAFRPVLPGSEQSALWLWPVRCPPVPTRKR